MQSLRKAAIGIALIAGGLSAMSPSAIAQKYNLTMCGASPGGLWSLLGAGVDAAMKAAYPGSSVTYQTSGGGFANVGQIIAGKCEMGLVHDAEARLAMLGKPPFRAKVDGLRAVAVMYTWAPMQLIVTKAFADKHGLKSMADIAAKKAPIRIMLNRRGNVASQVGMSMLNAAGADRAAIQKWGGKIIFAASRQQGELMSDRRADAILNSLFVGHRSLVQVGRAIPVVLLPIGEKTRTAVEKEWGIGGYTIKAGAYSWAPNPTPTVTLSALLFVKADADDKMVYNLTKALVTEVAKVRGVHKAMKPLTPKLMASNKALPYHPAALRYYKEAGLR